MDLQQRINAAGAYAVKNGRASGPRKWRREMAEAAGCSYQNIAQAAKGEQLSMDAELLRRIAKWSGVSEEWMVFDIGQMVDTQNDQQSASDFPGYTVRPYSDTKTVRAPVVEWARLGTDLYKDFSEIEALESLPVHENASRLVIPLESGKFSVHRFNADGAMAAANRVAEGVSDAKAVKMKAETL